MTTAESLAIAKASIERYLDDLRALVNLDSGTHDRILVETAGLHAAAIFEKSGCDVEWIKSSNDDIADTYVARTKGTGESRIVMLGHHDTVFAAGTAAERPYRSDGARAHGPGVSDMKSGVVLGAYAIRVLREQGFQDFAEIIFVGNPDEEIGSPTSRRIIEEEARRADLVLVLEPGRAPGAIQTTRKGVGMFELEVTGRAAHAGSQPEAGRSAVVELAHKTLALSALTDFETGATVNVGLIEGGTRRNVVPERARALIDLRVVSGSQATDIVGQMESIAASTFVDGTSTILSGGLNRPPMEKSAGTQAALEIGWEIVSELGLEPQEISSGGGSDGNFTAALGVPTLDGLGPVGRDAHSVDEWIDLESIPARLALLAGLIARAPRRPR
jgi:glutamate carboxypeptidase